TNKTKMLLFLRLISKIARMFQPYTTTVQIFIIPDYYYCSSSDSETSSCEMGEELPKKRCRHNTKSFRLSSSYKQGVNPVEKLVISKLLEGEKECTSIGEQETKLKSNKEIINEFCRILKDIEVAK